MTAPKDGKDLERAIELIERLILGAHQVPPHKLTIQPRKRVVTKIGARKVTDEVDLYVRIENAPDYEEVTIFESRDRVKPVDKNDIDAFRRKMKRAGASHGIFVGRKFTSGAVAVASERPVVKLHTVEDADEPIIIRGIQADTWAVERFGFTLRAGLDFSSFDDNSPAVLAGKKRRLSEVIAFCVEYASNVRASLEFGGPEQVVEFWQTIRMMPGDLTVCGHPVVAITVKGEVAVRPLEAQRIVSVKVGDRGRSIQRFYVKPDGEEVIFFETLIPEPTAR